MSDDIAAPTPVDFISLPTVEQFDAAAADRRSPRFDGDMSELPDRACWALQHLLTRRYINKDSDPDVWSWIMTYRRKLTVRVSELDLRLRIAEGSTSAASNRSTTSRLGDERCCGAKH